MLLSELLRRGIPSNPATPLPATPLLAIAVGAKWELEYASRPEFPMKEYFWELKYQIMHPITKEMQDLFTILLDLKELPDWTYEKIADWLQSVGC